MPVLFVVDHDPGSLSELLSDLSRRFGNDFRVRGEASADRALVALQEMATANERLALLLVDDADHLLANRQWLWLPAAADWLAVPPPRRSGADMMRALIVDHSRPRHTNWAHRLIAIPSRPTKELRPASLI